MASNAFKKALAAAKDSKNLDKVLVGSSYLPDGTHDVVIQAVDTADIDKDVFDVTYVDENGKSFKDKLFVLNREKTEFGYGVRSLLSATIPDKEALARFLEIVDQDDHAWEMFTGMKVRITIRPGAGYVVKATGTGTFVGYMVDKKGAIGTEPVTGEYETIEEVRADADEKDLYRSYARLSKIEARDKEANLAAFAKAVEAREKAAANGGVTAATFNAGKVV